MSEQESPSFRILSTDVFRYDPVAFGALMDYQYGEGVSQEEAARLLQEETRGISVDSLEMVNLMLPDIAFWLKLGEKKEKEPLAFRLYMNDRPASRWGAQILNDVGCRFEVVYTEAPFLSVNEGRSPLPILVDLGEGIPHPSLREVRNFARAFTMWKENPVTHRSVSFYKPQINFWNEGGYQDASGHWLQPEVWCFGPDGKKIFAGKIGDSLLPVEDMLGGHWYTKRGGKFHNIVAWDLGEWKDLLEKVNGKGHLISEQPPMVLFSDELEDLKEGAEQIIVDDHGCPYCVTYDGYFLKDGRLLRIWAKMID